MSTSPSPDYFERTSGRWRTREAFADAVAAEKAKMARLGYVDTPSGRLYVPVGQPPKVPAR